MRAFPLLEITDGDQEECLILLCAIPRRHRRAIDGDAQIRKPMRESSHLCDPYCAYDKGAVVLNFLSFFSTSRAQISTWPLSRQLAQASSAPAHSVRCVRYVPLGDHPDLITIAMVDGYLPA